MDRGPHATGLTFPTREEAEAFRASHPEVGMVLPNEIALKRINEARAAKGMPPIFGVSVAPMGQEIVPASENGILDTRIVTTGETLSESLPPYVDNSWEQYFPPIRSQGGLGSCTTFASTYYQFTYVVGLTYGWYNKNEDNTTKFSPRWTYNFVNFREGKENNGSFFMSNYGVLENHGAATWNAFPYDGSDYKQWVYNDPLVWRDAINYRAAPVYFIKVLGSDPTDALTEIKGILNDGYIVTFGTYVSCWNYTTIEDDPNITEDNAFNNNLLEIFGKPNSSLLCGKSLLE